MQPGTPGRGRWALVGGTGVEPETGDEQEARRQEKNEHPVGKRSGKEPTSDRRVALDDAEAQVDRRVPCAGLVGTALKNPDVLAPPREPADRRLELRVLRLTRIRHLGHGPNPKHCAESLDRR